MTEADEVLRADVRAARIQLRTLRNVVRDVLHTITRLEENLEAHQGTAEGGHSHEQDEDLGTRDGPRCVV